MKFHSFYYKIAAACCSVAVLATGCYGDKGNYDYHDINEVTISGIDLENVYQAYAYKSTLEISPKIHSSKDIDPSQYEYTWRIVPRNADADKGATLDEFIVSHEQNLVYPVQLADGDYTGFFEVKDPSTGVTWIQDFYLKVINEGAAGWLIACDDNGRTRLDLIAKDDKGEKDVLYPDLWKNIDFDMGKPLKIFFVGAGTEGFGFPALTTDKGSFALTGNDFQISDDTNLKWYFGIASDQLQVTCSAIETIPTDGLPDWWVIDEEGNIYRTECDMTAFFSYPINMVEGKTPFRAAPFIGVSYCDSWDNPEYTTEDEPWYNFAVIFYDVDGRRFLTKYGVNGYPSVMQCSGTQLFDVETGRDMVFIDSHDTGNNSLTVAVLKDPDSPRYYLYGMDLKYGEVEQLYYGEIGGPDIANARLFALHPTLNALFYATDNKAYRVSLANPGSAREILALDPGEEIVVFKYHKFSSWDAPSWLQENTSRLLVCSNKTNAEPDDPNVGTFRLYDIPSLEDEPITEALKIEGLGKIVDVTAKEYEGL